MFLNNFFLTELSFKTYSSIIISILFFTLILIYIFNKLSLKYNFLDIPDERKNHKFPTPISGGVIILFTTIFCYFFFERFFNQELSFYKDIIFISFCFFVIGIFDDIKKPKTTFKVIAIIVMIFLALFFSKDLLIFELRFKYLFINTLELKFLSYPFTIFCIFMFFNALNYADGKNGICISYSIFLLFFISAISADQKIFNHSLIFTLILLLLFNLKNKLFLGNNGVNFISIFLSLLIIKKYNLELTSIYCDEIFLLMLIPGLDAARVTIQRGLNKISPLKPDKRHFHHYLSKIFNENYIWLFYLLLSLLPIVIVNITENFFIALLLPILIYSGLILKSFKN